MVEYGLGPVNVKDVVAPQEGPRRAVALHRGTGLSNLLVQQVRVGVELR